MKIYLTLKDPDALLEAIDEAFADFTMDGLTEEELEKFFEAITAVRESSKDISERVSAICSHSICEAHKQAFLEEARAMKNKFPL